MHHFARTACTRHINCHLRSLLCQQGSTSTSAALHSESSVSSTSSLRSRRWQKERQFSSSHSEYQEAAGPQPTSHSHGSNDSKTAANKSGQRVATASSRAAPRRKARRQHAPPNPPPPAGIYKDPLHAIERLSTIRTPIQNYNGTLEEALESLPILRADGKEIAAANARERQIHNTAVSKLLYGISKRNWKVAFHQGWSMLYDRDGSHSRLNMDTTENLVRLWSQQTEETKSADWQAVLQKLLIPAAEREVELQNEYDSVIANWILSELAKDSPTGRQRCIEFWTTFIEHAKATSLAEKRGDPFYLLQIPTNLFSSALLAFFHSGSSLKDFIESFYDTIAVPSGFNPAVSMNRVRRLLDRSRGPKAQSLLSDEHLEELSYWYSQMPFIRIWGRVGQQSIRLACSTWRERRHQAAISSTWAALKQALQRVSSSQDQDWLVIDWASPEERRERSDNTSLAIEENNTAQEVDGPERTPATGREVWRQRPTLPVQFTPEVAADFIRTFMHVDLLDEAEAAWTFIQSLGLAPNVIMWTALLHGHLHRKDLNAAEAVFREMERNPEAAKPDMTARSILANAYLQAGETVAGREAVQNMLDAAGKGGKDNTITTRVYNNILTGLLWNNNSPEMALEVFQHMQDEGTPVDVYTVNILLRHYSRRNTFNLEGISAVLETLAQHNIEPDTYTLSMLLEALLLAGRPDAVAKVQEVMENLDVQANTATYGGMIDHLVKNSMKTGDQSRLETALQMLRHMQGTGQASTRPTEITYSGLIQGFCRFSVLWNSREHLDTAEALHDEMLQLGIPPNRITYNSLMAAHLAKDNVAKALYFFENYRDLKGRRALPQASAASDSNDLDASTTLRQNVSMLSSKRCEN
ncbi:hypothetical protein P389DRAFT_176885 [Cystobasidium minutum MCA 4210]|uniref:uncharacterized protein n=1 Tax=Cystobasidium minutum MCA 4210 TaxID=1397322 RepID=UPI0034CD3B08|eukprot:jgi/Rhomi1/176885/fgenesh1_pg.1_\